MYVCTLRCPHFAAPCEIGSVEYEQIATYKTPCPLGENDSFQYIDENNLFMCLAVGSRTFSDYSYFSMKMDKILASKTDKTIVILSGGADGTDSLAERYAKERNYIFLCMPADWEKGKSAGYKRNDKMHKYLASHEDRGCIAFWDGHSKGTMHSFVLAKKYANQIRLVKVEVTRDER